MSHHDILIIENNETTNEGRCERDPRPRGHPERPRPRVTGRPLWGEQIFDNLTATRVVPERALDRLPERANGLRTTECRKSKYGERGS